MPRRNPCKRTFKLIAFKAHHDCDQDILDWWESIEDGERSNVIRDVLREHLGHHPRPRRNRVIELNELMAMRQDTHWIRDAPNVLPATASTSAISWRSSRCATPTPTVW